MTGLPTLGLFTDAATTNGQAKQAQDDLRDFVAEGLGGAPMSELTIAGGTVSPTAGQHSIDTEADAAADDLTNIDQTSLADGRLLLLRNDTNGRTVTVKHGAGGVGQVLLADSADLLLDDTGNHLLLRRAGTTWVEVGRFFGTSAAAALDLLGGASEGQVLEFKGGQWVPGTGVPTGAVQSYVGTTAPAGWLLLQGGTIGSALSGGTARANADTEALFTLLWDSMADAQAPVSGGRGASAVADFAANKSITLPDLRGRSIIGAGTGPDTAEGGGAGAARTHGDKGGAETHTQTNTEVGPHEHQALLSTGAGATTVLNTTSGGPTILGGWVKGKTVGVTAMDWMHPWLALNFIVKL